MAKTNVVKNYCLQRLEAELSQYELLRQRNIADNKAVLAKLLADLEGFPLKAKIPARNQKKKVGIRLGFGFASQA